MSSYLKYSFYSFFGPLQNFQHLKKSSKFGIAGNPRPSGVIKWEIFGKKEELKWKTDN